MKYLVLIKLLAINYFSYSFSFTNQNLKFDLKDYENMLEVEYYYDSLMTEKVTSIDKKLSKMRGDDYIYNGDKPGCSWYKFTVLNRTNEFIVLEGRDPNIKLLEIYVIKEGGIDTIYQTLGKNKSFNERVYKSPQNIFNIPVSKGEVSLIYIRASSERNFNPHFVLDTTHGVFNRLLKENIIYGFLLGIVFFAIIYNLIIYFSLRDRLYTFFIFYAISVFLMSLNHFYIDLYVFESLQINGYYIEIICLILYSISLFIYVNGFLVTNTTDKRYTLILTLFFLCISFFEMFITGFSVWLPYLLTIILFYYLWLSAKYYLKGNQSALYLILGLASVIAGQVSFLTIIHLSKPGFFLYLSFYFGLVLDIVFFSRGLGERFRMLRIQKEKLDESLIQQLKYNQELKDNINRELELLVAERTHELELANNEIQRMNELLKLDNEKLGNDVKVISEARVMQKTMSFSEFKNIYLDDDACYKFLSELKWANGYKCIKCGNERYAPGSFPYSRRCVKCNYTESPMVNTIFEGVRFELPKAFYILYNIYASKKKVSSTEMASILNMRQKTSWAFINKIEDLLEKNKLTKRTNNVLGWTSWIFNAKN